ncbi:MAG: hypothetical protein AVDCRST_MAG41-2867 [uncultured Corynebacteriales bacterium]|uniref:Uncharacterized protein n=1 Tax=uncultured Mycobacteriales bacterium TaxID=581187 RepID=A0A6J4J3I6_9ACTN|nr:MAG: hypothetical protein AVDCRST_MAG41-2867 [uncultured Corynebacteriales bacterium]
MTTTGPYGIEERERPTEVTWAWAAMVAQVALAVLGSVAALFMGDTLRDYFREIRPRATAAEIDQAVDSAFLSAVFFGVLFAVGWLWLAARVRRGTPWARTVTLVFAGIGILFGLLRLATDQPALVRVSDVAGLLLDVAIVVLLFRLRAQAFFRRDTRYRAPSRRRPVS